MWSSTRLNKAYNCDNLLPRVDTRHQSVYPADSPSTSVFRHSSSSVCATDGHETDLTARLRHPHLHTAQHHYQQQQQQQQQDEQQQMTMKAKETVERLRSVALLDSIWSPWRPTPPAHLQLLAVYRSHFWTRLISSLLGAGSATPPTQAPAAALVRVRELSDRHSLVRQSQPVPEHSPTLSDQRATEVTAVEDGDDRQRSRNLVNWLLDSPSALAAKTAKTSTTFGVDASARQLLFEQTLLGMRGCGHVCDLTEFGCGTLHGVSVGDGGRLAGSAGRLVDGALSCRLCLKRYATPGAMKMHARTHTLPCRCAVCGKAFSRPWLLQGHLRTHTGERPFACSQCQRAFADRSNLRAHLQTHAAVKKYGCSRCAKTFSRMSLLVKHEEGTACPGRILSSM